MIILGRTFRQLDHWRGLFEYLPTPVQYEMVVRGDFGERYGPLSVEASKVGFSKLEPRHIRKLRHGDAEAAPLKQDSAQRP